MAAMMREWMALLCAQINFCPLRAAHWENRRARLCQCTSLPNWSLYYWDVSNFTGGNMLVMKVYILFAQQKTHKWNLVKFTLNTFVTASMMGVSGHKDKERVVIIIKVKSQRLEFWGGGGEVVRVTKKAVFFGLWNCPYMLQADAF